MQESTKNCLLLSVGVIASTGVAILVFIAVPVYVAMYSQYEGTLPLETRLLFEHYKWVMALPLVVLGFWWLLQENKNRALITALIGIVGGFIVVLVGYWAAFQPEVIVSLVEHNTGQP